MEANATRVGWQDQPDGRGTFDILKSCIGTVVLLCWTSVCPNLPRLKGGRWSSLSGKTQLFLLALIGPDFIYMLALGQLNAAWRAKKAFHAEGHTNWTLRQCFFANMGGIHVLFDDRAHLQQPTFPIDAAQLLHLVKRQHVKLPEIDDDEVEERNKTDELGRALAILQSLWFTIDVFGRIAQRLHITTLELTTLAFVFLMSACAVCWWRKPMDIRRPIIIKAQSSLSTVIGEVDSSGSLYGATPLSFLNRREWFMSQLWTSYVQVLRNLRLIPRKKFRPTESDHFSSIDFPETDVKWEFIGGPLIVMYSSIFMAAWRFDFPTDTERTLWHAASIACLVYGALGCIMAWIWHNATESRYGMQKLLPERMLRDKEAQQQNTDEGENRDLSSGQRGTAHRLLFRLRRVKGSFHWMRNWNPDCDPNLAVPLRLWIPTTILCAVYAFSRAYILIEDLIALRSLPRSAYQTVDWSQYAPIF